MKLYYHPISTTSRPIMFWPQVYQVIDGYATSLKGKTMVAVGPPRTAVLGQPCRGQFIPLT